jgi:catechol 2,3-dioxygenase
LDDRDDDEESEEEREQYGRTPSHRSTEAINRDEGGRMAETEVRAETPGEGIEPQEVGHVVLRVRDLDRSSAFYQLLGFREVGRIGGVMAFFTATGENHHDLALQAVGRDAPSPSPNAVGLYHVAIRLPSDDHVRTAYRALANAGVELVGSSDHGVSHSLYIKDPDGIELELYADVPGWEEIASEVATIRAWDPR